MSKKMPKREISCIACGYTVVLRKYKIEPCDYYLCGRRICPGIEHPIVPDGYIRVCIFNTAGSFEGFKLQQATYEELESIERARELVRKAFPT